MKAILIDVNEDKVKLVDPKGLKDYYRLIGCHTVDIVCRRINGKYFNIICDDEGLLTENPKIAAIDKNRDPMLVGNLIIVGDVDDDGGLLGLNEEDVKLINANITTIRTMRYPKGYKVLANVEYLKKRKGQRRNRGKQWQS
mgnify:CR=1 FL=1